MESYIWLFIGALFQESSVEDKLIEVLDLDTFVGFCERI